MGRRPKAKGLLSSAIQATSAADGAISKLEHLWAQDPEETDDEYQAFHTWLARGQRRGAPPEEWRQVASRYNWSRRAIAYAKAWELAKADDKAAPEVQVIDNLLRTVQLEADKLLKAAAEGPGGVLSVKDLLACVNLIAELQKKSQEAKTAVFDPSVATAEELEIVLQAQDIMQDWARRREAK